MAVVGMVLAGGFGRRMGGEKPKVLYEVDGVPMVVRALEALRGGGVNTLVAVLSHASDQVSAALPEDVQVVTQVRPRGTASAVIDAPDYIKRDEDTLVVSFGDMPWLNPRSCERLVGAIGAGADAAVLTYEFDDPPHFGRIIRGEGGVFETIRQYKDCSEVEKQKRELDAGMFAFRVGAIRPVLGELDDNNAAGEMYLTDVPGRIAARGGKVDCVAAERLEEVLGVNDKRHLEFAEQLVALRDAEEVMYLADEVFDAFYAAGEGPG